MPLSSKDSPKTPDPDEAAAKAANPHASQDPNIPDGPEADLDPAKVVGTYAMQPDPNADRPAPTPVVPPGVKKAPADDEPGAPAIGGNPEKK
jgi:hypothetical protein